MAKMTDNPFQDQVYNEFILVEFSGKRDKLKIMQKVPSKRKTVVISMNDAREMNHDAHITKRYYELAPNTSEPKGLDQMTKNELIDYAREKEISVDSSANKAEILAAIQDAELN